MTNGDPIEGWENGPQHLRVSIADVEIAELRGDMQGRVAAHGATRGPRKLLVPVMGRRPRRKKPREDQGATRTQSRVERTNVKMATHKDQSWCGLRLMGCVCVRERDAGLEEQFQKISSPLAHLKTPFSLQPHDHRKK